jgi:phage shock protein A
MHGLKDASAFETFERMASKIDQLESEAEAEGELQEEQSGDVLASKFASLERSKGAEDDLAALKRKMGLMPAEEPAAEKADVQARVQAPVSVRKSEEDELAAALEEMEAEQQAEEKKRAGR